MITGGYNGKYLSRAEILDLHTGNWKTVKDLLTPRSWHCAVKLNGKVYGLGGQNNVNGYLNNVESFDIEKNEWYQESSLNESRDRFGAVTYDNRFFCTWWLQSKWKIKNGSIMGFKNW